MPQILVDLDEATLAALNRVAPAAPRQRAEFIRTAVKAALRELEFERMRIAYRQQPNIAGREAHDWANAERWD